MNLGNTEHFLIHRRKYFLNLKNRKRTPRFTKNMYRKTINEYINDNIIDGSKIQKDFILASIVSNNMI